MIWFLTSQRPSEKAWRGLKKILSFSRSYRWGLCFIFFFSFPSHSASLPYEEIENALADLHETYVMAHSYSDQDALTKIRALVKRVRFLKERYGVTEVLGPFYSQYPMHFQFLLRHSVDAVMTRPLAKLATSIYSETLELLLELLPNPSDYRVNNPDWEEDDDYESDDGPDGVEEDERRSERPLEYDLGEGYRAFQDSQGRDSRSSGLELRPKDFVNWQGYLRNLYAIGFQRVVMDPVYMRENEHLLHQLTRFMVFGISHFPSDAVVQKAFRKLFVQVLSSLVAALEEADPADTNWVFSLTGYLSDLIEAVFGLIKRSNPEGSHLGAWILMHELFNELKDEHLAKVELQNSELSLIPQYQNAFHQYVMSVLQSARQSGVKLERAQRLAIYESLVKAEDLYRFIGLFIELRRQRDQYDAFTEAFRRLHTLSGEMGCVIHLE